MMKQETFNAIMQYLATKPYNEVAPLFNMIMKDMESNPDTETHIVEEK